MKNNSHKNRSYDDGQVLFSLGSVGSAEPVLEMTFRRVDGDEFFDLYGSLAFCEDLGCGYAISEQFTSEGLAWFFATKLKRRLELWSQMSDEEKKEYKVELFPFGDDDIHAVDRLITSIGLMCKKKGTKN